MRAERSPRSPAGHATRSRRAWSTRPMPWRSCSDPARRRRGGGGPPEKGSGPQRAGGGGGLLEKRIRLHRGGELSVRYRWDPAAFPVDACFCPEVSLAREAELELAPAGEVWQFPITTVSRSERGFEETVQGYSYTPRWPVRAREARLIVQVRPPT